VASRSGRRGLSGSHRRSVHFLTTMQRLARDDRSRKKGERRRDKKNLALRPVPLHEALDRDRVVVVGDPGAGKTTFLRRVAHTLCQTELGEVPDAAYARIGISERTFPILVRLSRLDDHILRHRNDPQAPTEEDAPAWLPPLFGAKLVRTMLWTRCPLFPKATRSGPLHGASGWYRRGVRSCRPQTTRSAA